MVGRILLNSALLKRFSQVRKSGCFGNGTCFQSEKVLHDFSDHYHKPEIAVTITLKY